MLELFKNNIDLVLKLLALGAVVMSGIRIMIEYFYSIDMQNYFNVPYKYFMVDWKRSLAETMVYGVTLMVIFGSNCMFIVSTERENIYSLLTAVVCFFAMNFMYVFAITSINLILGDLKVNIKRNIIISVVLSLVFDALLILRVFPNATLIACVFAIYILLCIFALLFGTSKCFAFRMKPEKMYEVLMLNRQKYAIVGKGDQCYVVKKITVDNSFNPSDPYMFISVDDVSKCEIHRYEIKRIKKETTKK